ncbi:hypothetical protein QAD02_005678 [Eretmocerus hayati]|uniref:Uncharacterized protein n=1 Tax=Eretmocerus hayati TaxID=131215 RepID=A0ACC2NU92_9HYME|nr:hypothetical protein QAD02_005678 [Eretmocerus hayati]
MEERLLRTHFISDRIRSFGYNLIEKWECDFVREKRCDDQLSEFLKTCEKDLRRTPLIARETFFGGRTGNTARLMEVGKSKRKIYFVDVCSLYPSVCKDGEFPVGHPKIYVGEECEEFLGRDLDIKKVKGLIKCTVLPPTNLYFPVLPVRMHDKLLFPLCRTCCEEMRDGNCTHTQDSEREIEGSWVSLELQAAVEAGYKVTEVHEIWHYKTTKYSRVTKAGGLFAGYINSWLKIKQESSGWPPECTDNETKMRYIAEYERVEGIKLDFEKIEKNPGKRALAKAALCSLWGKFAQRENLTKTEVVKTQERFMELFTSPELEITGMLPVNDDTMYVSYVHKIEALEPSCNRNIVIASFVTAQARLVLYN